MEPARTSPPAAFTDGLGDRHHTDGPGSEPLEILTLRRELSTAPAFEFALRERVSRLAGFRHPSYAGVRGVSRLGSDSSSLALVSDRIAGERLSQILAVADRELISLEIGAGLAVIRQLLETVAVLHETAREVCHGAIALERIVITPDGQLVLVEHVLGGALSSLQYSRDRYWKELRVALPATAGAPHFDRRADVTQIGAIALALIAGRPLGDNDYPDRVSEIISRIGAVSATGGLEPLPDAFKAWLSRALQLDPRQSFGSAVDAREEFDRVLSEAGYAPAPARFSAFLAQYRASATTPAPPTPVALPPVVPVFVPPPPAKRPASSPSVSLPSSSIRLAQAPRDVRKPAAPAAPAVAAAVGNTGLASGRRRAVAAALFVVVASMATLTARTFLAPIEVPPAETGTLIVNTYPSGADVIIDGRRRGVTPLVVGLMPGEHNLEVIGETERRNVPVFILAGGQIAQMIKLTPPAAAVERPTASMEPEPQPEAEVAAPAEAPPAAAAPAEPSASEPGWLAVAAPAEVQVFADRRLLGTSRTSRIAMPAGRHQIEIVNEPLGYRAVRSIAVTPGKVTSLKLEWPKGSLSVNALPWADVSINGERIGETPLGDVSLPIGTHDVVFRHPELGEQRHRVTVTAGSPARLSVDLRKR